MACCNDGRPKDFWANHEETPVTRKFYARHDTEITEKDMELAKRFALELSKSVDVCVNDNSKDKSIEGIHNKITTDKSITSCDVKPKEFRPNYSFKPLTTKFYARHDTQMSENIKIKAENYQNEVQKRLTHDPRKNRFAPVTENQVYGWLGDRNMPRDPYDSAKQYFPRTSEEEFKLQAQIYLDSQNHSSFVRK